MTDVARQDHYMSKQVQPIEVLCVDLPTQQFIGFLRGNVIKYVMRYDQKNHLEDLKKAQVYLNWLVELYEKEGITVADKFVSRPNEKDL
jgi:hypothetical protein